MINTQRIRIKEVCSMKNNYNLIDNTYLHARKIKRLLCETNSYVDIKKMLVAGYNVENPMPNDSKYVRIAFLDVCWRDTKQAKELQTILSDENGEATIVINDLFTWHITPQNKEDNLYHNTMYSITTIYLKNAGDLYTDEYNNIPTDADTFFGIMFLNKYDDDELPGPIPAYRSMRYEYILDKGNVDLDETL